MRWLLALIVLASCGNATHDPGERPDAASASLPDGSTSTPADAATGSDPSQWRTSLASCWTDVSCTRALLIAHGGEWKLANPAYGSTAAYDAAFTDNADAIKADVRFSQDGVAVVVHSSPFQAYEIDPLDFSCLGARVEQLTAADIVACRWINGDHIQRLDTLLAWANAKTIIMLTVKDESTIPQTIAAVIAAHATDYAFLEISTSAMTTIVPNAASHDQVYYLVEAANQADVTTVLGLHDPRAFMIEDANADGFGGMTAAAVGTLVSTQLHPAHVRSFSSVASISAGAADHTALWSEGFDVVMTNSYAAGHVARIALDTSRGVTPP
jgi:glycerophosphoryl diester phosphodiesterase